MVNISSCRCTSFSDEKETTSTGKHIHPQQAVRLVSERTNDADQCSFWTAKQTNEILQCRMEASSYVKKYYKILTKLKGIESKMHI